MVPYSGLISVLVGLFISDMIYEYVTDKNYGKVFPKTWARAQYVFMFIMIALFNNYIKG